MEEKKTIIKVDDVTVRFNMASERIDNLKEYIIKAVKRELMFKEFLALQNIFRDKKGRVMGTYRCKRLRKVNSFKADFGNFKAL